MATYNTTGWMGALICIRWSVNKNFFENWGMCVSFGPVMSTKFKDISSTYKAVCSIRW